MKKASNDSENFVVSFDGSCITSALFSTNEVNISKPNRSLDHQQASLLKVLDTIRCRPALASLSSGEHLVGAKMLTKQSAIRAPVKRYSDVMLGSEIKPVPKAGSTSDVPTKSTMAGKLLDIFVPPKRTGSFQNISQLLSGSDESRPQSAGALHRAASLQNLDMCANAPRTSPISISMACNAELLASFERERRHFEDRISELLQVAETRRTEAERLKIELRELRLAAAVQSAEVDEVSLLHRENQVMRSRLAEFNVTIDHFTDAEKLTLLQAHDATEQDAASVSGGREVSKMQTFSDVGDSTRDNDGDLALSGGSLDANWDRASEGALTVGSGSEVSMACLQDRLLAMEETQYSTNEELAATLQELGDLQNAINSLTAENERLADERTILLESLCTQTQKLENSRRQIQHLKTLLFRDGGSEERSENERQLMALVRSAEEERQELLLKQAELCNSLEMLESDKQELSNMTISLREQLSGVFSDKCMLEMQVTSLTDKVLQDADELQHCQLAADRMQSAASVDNLEQDVCLQCQHLEVLLTNSQLELASATSDCIQLRSQLTDVESQLKDMQHSALCQSAEMERRLREAERDSEEARSAINTLRVNSSRTAEEQRAVIACLESDLRIARMRVADAERAASEMSAQFDAERKEWESFQRDLQTAVVVAVDIRSEAQEDMERLRTENQTLRDHECTIRRELEATQTELARLRTAQQIHDRESAPSASAVTMRDHFMSSVDRELSLFHQSGRRASDLCLPSSISSSASQPSLSVQRLISSIEEQIKSVDIPVADSSTCDLRTRRGSNFGRSVRDAVSPVVAKPVLMRYWSQSPGNKAVGASASGKRNTIEGSAVGATDEAKCAVAESSVLPTAAVAGPSTSSTRKPLTGILSNKSARQKTIHG